jgi:hypothetical protein
MPHQVEIIDSRFLICGATIRGTIIFLGAIVLRWPEIAFDATTKRNHYLLLKVWQKCYCKRDLNDTIIYSICS